MQQLRKPSSKSSNFKPTSKMPRNFTTNSIKLGYIYYIFVFLMLYGFLANALFCTKFLWSACTNTLLISNIFKRLSNNLVSVNKLIQYKNFVHIWIITYFFLYIGKSIRIFFYRNTWSSLHSSLLKDFFQ